MGLPSCLPVRLCGDPTNRLAQGFSWPPFSEVMTPDDFFSFVPLSLFIGMPFPPPTSTRVQPPRGTVFFGTQVGVGQGEEEAPTQGER